MISTVYLLVHVFLGATTSAVITKSYTVPLLLLFAYWTLGFVGTGLDGTPLEVLTYWSVGPTLGVLGVLCGTLVSNLLGVPRLLDALLMPNDRNKQANTGVRRLAWEVPLLHLLTLLIFLAVKFIIGEFSNDSTSTLAAGPSLALGITLAIVGILGVIVVVVVAAIGDTHRFEKRQNIKYFVQHFLQVGLLPVIAIAALPCQAYVWWVSPVYVLITLGITLLAYVHTVKFTYFAGTLAGRHTGSAFFSGTLAYRDTRRDAEGLLGADETAANGDLADNMVSTESALRFFVPLLVLSLVTLLVDWVTLYWIQVTSVMIHGIVLGTVAALFIVGILLAYFFIVRVSEEEGEAAAAYPAFTGSRVGRPFSTLDNYLAHFKGV